MKLSLKLIARQIRQGKTWIAASRRIEPDTMRLTSLMLFEPGGGWEASAAYAVAAENLTEDFRCPRGIALIVLGQADPERFSQADADVLIWQPAYQNTGFAAQFNDLSRIFQEYRQMELQMLDRLISGASPDELTSLWEKYMGNPIILMDDGFSMLLKPRRTNPLEWEPGRFPQTPTLSAEVINQIQMSRAFLSREDHQGMFYLSSDTLDCGVLFLNVREDGISLYIAVLEMDQPIMPSDWQLLHYFSRHLCHCLRMHRFSRTDTLYFLQFLTKLLRNEKIELPEFNRQLQTQQWKINQRYVCIVVEPDLWNQKNSQAFSLCRIMERRFRGCCAFSYEDRIVCIVNLSQAELEREVFLHMLSQFIRDQLLRVGVSYEFKDFVSLPNYYHQATAALELGKQQSPDEWSYRFEKYVMTYFIRYGTSRMEGKYLCHPDLVALLYYDRENHAELLHTLKVYLACGLNATTTAGELFIHRNTLYQRLSKIESLISSNLNNPETRLYLQISYCIADFDSIL